MDGYSLIEMVMVILLMSVAIPGLVGLYTTVLTNSHNAEIMTVADLLAVEQMEIIFADKHGSGLGGYNAINSGRYSSVNPTGYFSAYTRTVNIQTINAGQPYEYKLITVTVNHPLIPSVVLNAAVLDHSGL